MDAHEVLVNARNLLDRVGWVQGSVHGPNGRCMVGALGFDGQASLDAGEVLASVISVKQGRQPTLWSAVGKWNDAPGRTKAEVLAAFDEAIAATAPSPADPFAGDPVSGSEAIDQSLSDEEFSRSPEATVIP